MTTQTFANQIPDGRSITVTYWTLHDGTTVYAEIGPQFAVLKYWHRNQSDGAAIVVRVSDTGKT